MMGASAQECSAFRPMVPFLKMIRLKDLSNHLENNQEQDLSNQDQDLSNHLENNQYKDLSNHLENNQDQDLSNHLENNQTRTYQTRTRTYQTTWKTTNTRTYQTTWKTPRHGLRPCVFFQVKLGANVASKAHHARPFLPERDAAMWTLGPQPVRELGTVQKHTKCHNIVKRRLSRTNAKGRPDRTRRGEVR